MIRRRPRSAADPSPLLLEMLEWAAQFEGGTLSDPALLDGTLEPGERFAVRIGPLVRARLDVTPSGPRVLEAGITGSLVATDRRALLLPSPPGGALEACPAPEDTVQWWWATDVSGVTALALGLGVMWSPSDARFAAGINYLEGAVLPAFARGEIAPPKGAPPLLPMFMRVQAAWRASQPGGVEAWRRELADRHGPA